MSFLLYVVVLVVSVSSVMMGLDWLSTPPPPLPKSVQTVVAPAKPTAPLVANKVASTKTEAAKPAPTERAKTTGKASPTTIVTGDVAKQPETGDIAPAGVSDNAQAATSDGTPSIMANERDVKGATAQAKATAPRCDVQACAARYQTFDASDCTFQPYEGPRRLCTVGNPPKQDAAAPAGEQTSDASKQPSSCNYDACAAAYRSFDPATCTWQPFEGPRRACEK